MQSLSPGVATSPNFEHFIMLGATHDNNSSKRDGFFETFEKSKNDQTTLNPVQEC